MSDFPKISQEQWLKNGEQRTHALRSSTSSVPPWLQTLYDAFIRGTLYSTLKLEKVSDIDSDSAPLRYSAVLILFSGDSTHIPTKENLYPEDATLVLTHRTPSLRTHSGQIAFPGGGREEGDRDPIDTALREAQEEIALDANSVEIWGCAEPVYVRRSNYVVVPVLGYWKEPGTLVPSPAENDWVGTVPLSHLSDPSQRLYVQFDQWKGPAFWVENYLLWGFTGGVVTTLIQVAGWEQEWDNQAPVDLGEALEQSRNQEPLAALFAAMRQSNMSSSSRNNQNDQNNENKKNSDNRDKDSEQRNSRER